MKSMLKYSLALIGLIAITCVAGVPNPYSGVQDPNYAYARPATSNMPFHPSEPVENCFDNNLNTNCATEYVTTGVVFITIDLGQPRQVQFLTFISHNYHSPEHVLSLNGVEAYVGASPDWTQNGAPVGTVSGVTESMGARNIGVPTPKIGRYVTLVKHADGVNQIKLVFGEVMVFPHWMDNFAFWKIATMTPPDSNFPAANSVDGDQTTTCMSMGAADTASVYTVDLGFLFDIGLIRLYAQNPGGGVIVGYQLWACNDANYQNCGTPQKVHDSAMDAPSGILDIEPPNNGIWNARYVHIVVPADNGNAAYGLRLSEVEVYPWKAVISSVTGDPQFAGFLNQQYQVHGTPGHIYDIITTPNMQVNAEFVFLNEGKCPKYENDATLCWTHPGTYLGSIGLTMAVKQHGENTTIVRVLVQSGAADKGLSVFIDEEALLPSSEHVWDLSHGRPMSREKFQHTLAKTQSLPTLSASASAPILEHDGWMSSNLTSETELEKQQNIEQKIRQGGVKELRKTVVEMPDAYHVTIYTKEFKMTFVNSDNFVNQEVSLLRMDLAGVTSEERVHGILGQTVRMKRYANRWRYIEGDVEEYSVDSLFSCNDDYSLAKKICEQQNDLDEKRE